VSHGKCVGYQSLGDDVGLVFEPLQTGENEECTDNINGGTCEENAPLAPKQPQSGGDHDEDAEPGDLAARSKDGISGDSKAQPEDGGAIAGRLYGPEATVEADDDGEEAKDIGHISDREHEIERRKNQCKSADRRVPLRDVCANHRSLQHKRQYHRY
jgi:hypothetical protein